jgi:hypothetical protein
MLSASDSFIEYLANELSPLQVYWWRKGDIESHAGFLKQDALNVSLLGFWEDDTMEMCLISLDLLASDERTALTNLQLLRDALLAVQFVQERDFSDPAAPRYTRRNITWDARKVRFISVRTPAGARYAHYNATFPLVYTRE